MVELSSFALEMLEPPLQPCLGGSPEILRRTTSRLIKVKRITDLFAILVGSGPTEGQCTNDKHAEYKREIQIINCRKWAIDEQTWSRDEVNLRRKCSLKQLDVSNQEAEP